MNKLENEIFDCLRSNCSGLKEFCERHSLNVDDVGDILTKWAENGLYEYGINLYTGWLTDEGLHMDMDVV